MPDGRAPGRTPRPRRACDPAADPDTTRLGALKVLGEAFRAGGIETAQRDARLLTLAAAGIVHADLIRAPRAPLGDAAATLDAHARRLIAREPVARILGEWEFWSLPFTLSADTLVPRPDSETVVGGSAAGAGAAPACGWPVARPRSGHRQRLPAHRAVGRTARCQRGRRPTSPPARSPPPRPTPCATGSPTVRSFVESDWASAITGQFDLIVSNPPYVADPILDGLEPEVRVHDPRLALSAGRDGLDAYRATVAALPDLLRPAAS